MHLLAEMSWEEVREYRAREDRVIVPLGATEQHGRHLGLGTDSIEAETIAMRVGERTGIAVAPTLNYGMSHAHLDFPGTLSLRPTTLIAVLEDILRALHRHGFRRVFIVNGHGGNTAALMSAVHLVANDLRDVRVKYFEWWTDAEAYHVIIEMLGAQVGSHASPGETAFMLAANPRAVKLERLTGRDAPVMPAREITTVNTFAQKYPDGIMGLDPRNATREVGEALIEKSVEICAREITEWK
jgi:creatinine amidohydrolase